MRNMVITNYVVILMLTFNLSLRRKFNDDVAVPGNFL